MNRTFLKDLCTSLVSLLADSSPPDLYPIDTVRSLNLLQSKTLPSPDPPLSWPSPGSDPSSRRTRSSPPTELSSCKPIKWSFLASLTKNLASSVGTTTTPAGTFRNWTSSLDRSKDPLHLRPTRRNVNRHEPTPFPQDFDLYFYRFYR